MFLINGAESETLAVNDRGVQFGDGCFTTARILRGQVQLLSAHLARLQTTCEKLFIPYDDWALLAQEMAHLAQPLRVLRLARLWLPPQFSLKRKARCNAG